MLTQLMNVYGFRTANIYMSREGLNAEGIFMKV